MKTYWKLALLLQIPQVSAITTAPNLVDLDSALTILRDNDLYAQESTRTSSGILIEEPKTFYEARRVCQRLGESLWSPEAQDFAKGLNNTLSYQVYLKKFPSSQQFWVSGRGCTSINAKGKSRILDCGRHLPAICTQNAPFSNSTFADTSPRFRITQQVGQQKLTGYRDADSWRFFGVRFAPNPRRFTHSSVFDGKGSSLAIDHPPRCLQVVTTGTATGSEDCLFLNIWTSYLPKKKVAKKDLKPVLLFIYGGANTQGTISDPGADGGNFASRGDAVVVAINYRLGNLGWLALEGEPELTGNYGLSDQVTGLKWVQKYIESFGGDPRRITIVGESSGASGVRSLMASKKAAGLFQGAIMESTPGGLTPNRWFTDYRTIPEHSAAFGPAVLDATNCTDKLDKVACLRQVDGASLNSLAVLANYPVMDYKYLDTRGLQVTGKGRVNSVPTMIGVTRDELAIAIGAYYGLFPTLEQSLAFISQIVGQDLTYLADNPAFPLPGGDSDAAIFNVTTRVVSDGLLLCDNWAVAFSAAKHHVLPSIYAFEFNRTYQPANFNSDLCSPPRTAEHPLGDNNLEYYKCHAGEVNYVIGALQRVGLPDRDGHDIPFSQLVIDRWASFVWKYDPNPSLDFLKARGFYNTINQLAVSGKWKKVNARNPELMRMQWNSKSAPFTEGPQCKALKVPLDYYETYF